MFQVVKSKDCNCITMAKKPEVFIFDDSFSALDFKTDANLEKQ